MLLVHGDDDIQVVSDHSRRMARVLDREKKKYELVVIKDGNHSLSRYEWRADAADETRSVPRRQ